ncbi:MAG: EAL domain-containing protein [Ectothiorhodospiraceae bacterium]|nr:EAL domain-containing protein [Ectothiorhodospiraceae bacterium]MCH8504355.1 EAL domain-containing protein [Ectothiorhodospiraceae bacterium]
MNQDEVLRLLIAEASLNDAEMYISVLRNAGHAVRAHRVEDEDELHEALEQKSYDLFLCHTGLESLPLSSALQGLQQSARDLPVIAVAEQDDPAARQRVMSEGAADLVGKQDLGHLQLVIRREFSHLLQRRRLRQLERALKETERRCNALLDSSRDAIAYVHEGMHIYANPAYLEKFGVEQFDDIEGMPLLDMISSQYQGQFKTYLKNFSKGDFSTREAELAIETDAGPLEVVAYFSAASIDGEPCTQILLRDQSSAKELEEQLESLSRQDLVTGLFNRVHFQEQLDEAMTEMRPEEGEPAHGLLYIQVDNYQTVSQQMGMTTCDKVMADLADIIRAEVDDSCLAARFADDVVTVFIPHGGIHEAVATAEAIRQKLEDHIVEAGERTVTASCSIGVVMVGERSGDVHQVLADAGLASETARSGGGNRVHLHSAGSGEGDGEEQAAWRDRLEDGMADNRLFLVFMPVASLQGEDGERYEVRLRLRDDDGTEIHPSSFIPAAEQLGMMDRIDHWVVSTAVKALAERQKAQPDTSLFVKLSAQSLGSKDFLAHLASELKASGVQGKMLGFQINEPVAMTKLNEARVTFRGLKELGCGFFLDNFGSGLNPFQLVKHLPADMVKLDRTLVADLTSSEETEEKVKAIIDNAHAMKKQVVAGYVEDAMCLARLWQHGVDFVQGNFLQSPSPDMNYDFSGMVI